ncbi:MAG: hypothetical protein ACOH2J_20490 [Allorhizobium sp.]
MREYQTHQIIDRIIGLDERHIAVALFLLTTMTADDPEVAQTWLDLAADASKDGEDPQGLFILPENVFYALHGHVRYGYVIQWLANWSVESFRLKGELAKRLQDGWEEINGVLTDEYDRRQGRSK